MDRHGDGECRPVPSSTLSVRPSRVEEIYRGLWEGCPKVRRHYVYCTQRPAPTHETHAEGETSAKGTLPHQLCAREACSARRVHWMTSVLLT